MPVIRHQAGASIDEEDHAIALGNGGFRLLAHAGGEAVRRGILKARRVDHGEPLGPMRASPRRRSARHPGWSSTSASFLPTRRLKSVDLPTLGRPTRAILRVMGSAYRIGPARTTASSNSARWRNPCGVSASRMIACSASSALVLPSPSRPRAPRPHARNGGRCPWR